jgi:predicted nucleotidyltransferase
LSGPIPDRRLELEPILSVLEKHGVDFVVVGGIAGMAHGSSYPSYDLDIAYGRDDANLESLAEALRELEVTLTNAPPDLPFQTDAETLRNGANFTFDTEFGRFDILGHIAGVKSYDELKARSRQATLEGRGVRIASIDDMIAMKRASARAKDKTMLEEYIVIADEQRKLAESDQAE